MSKKFENIETDVSVTKMEKIKSFGWVALGGAKCLWEIPAVQKAITKAVLVGLAKTGLITVIESLLTAFAPGVTVFKWIWKIAKLLKQGWDIYQAFKAANKEEDQRMRYMAYGEIIGTLIMMVKDLLTQRKNMRVRNRMRAIRRVYRK